MDEGQRINITFLHFDIGCTGSTDTVFACGLFKVNQNSCTNDWLQVEDNKLCGEIPTPFSIITNKNNVNIRLKTSTIDTRTGFLAIWSASNDPTAKASLHLTPSIGSKRFKGTKATKGGRGKKGGIGKKNTRGNLGSRGRGKKGTGKKKGARRG